MSAFMLEFLRRNSLLLVMNEYKVVCYFEYINQQGELLTNEKTTSSSPILKYANLLTNQLI